MTHTIIVSPDGLTGRVENPYDNDGQEGLFYMWEADPPPPRPLTKHHEPGTRVRGREVWQIRYFHPQLEDFGKWMNTTQEQVKFDSSSLCETRLAFEIIEEAAVGPTGYGILGDYKIVLSRTRINSPLVTFGIDGVLTWRPRAGEPLMIVDGNNNIGYKLNFIDGVLTVETGGAKVNVIDKSK